MNRVVRMASSPPFRPASTPLSDSPLAYRFAGGVVLVLPALVFIFFMRKYLTNMWGSTIR